MSAALAKNVPLRQCSLKIVRGAEKGTIFDIQSEQVTVGRSQENDIVLAKDPKVSRQHAEIDLSDIKIRIRDISERNFIYIDNERCKFGILAHGSRLKIGQTEFEFSIEEGQGLAVVEAPVQKPHLAAVPSLAVEAPKVPTPMAVPSAPQMTPPAVPPTFPQAPPTPPPVQPTNSKGGARNNGSRKNFYIIVGVVGMLLVYLLSSSPKKQEEELEIRSSEEILKDNEASRMRRNAVVEARQKSGQNSRQYDEAQSAYLRCFRDYRQGQYSRAIQHCRAALAIYSRHTLAQRYLQLSRRRLDEKIQHMLRQGRKFHEKGYFSRCTSALKSVMYELKDPSHQMYKEAKQLHSECQTLSQGRF